jgi:hypothetical protein
MKMSLPMEQRVEGQNQNGDGGRAMDADGAPVISGDAEAADNMRQATVVTGHPLCYPARLRP